MLVVANAFYYNAALALGTLQQQGRLKWFFTLWLEVPPHPFLLVSSFIAESIAETNVSISV